MSSRRSTGELELGWARWRLTRLALAGALISYPFFGSALATWLMSVLLGRSDATGQHAWMMARVAIQLATFGLCTALPPYLAWLRAPSPCRLDWDEEGVREYEGDQIRTMLAWPELLATVANSGRARVLQLSDGSMRRITLAERGASLQWLRRRRAFTADPTALLAALQTRPSGPPIEPDPRDLRRPMMNRTPVLAALGFGVLTAIGFQLSEDFRSLTIQALAFGLGTAFALPMIKSFRELLDALATERIWTRCESVTIDAADDPANDEDASNEMSEAVVRRADRTLLRIRYPRASLFDPNALQREGKSIRIVLPQAGWLAARTKLELRPAVDLVALETTLEHETRMRVLRAAQIELAARGLAAGFWLTISIAPSG